MKIAFGSDHAGFSLRQRLEAWAEAHGHHVLTFGASSEESFDYPVASDEVAQALGNKSADFGVLICGTGIGVSIRANRHHGIRAALCCSPEMAILARKHNDANVLCIGARMTESEAAVGILEVFLATEADPSERHQRRVALLDANVE